MKQRAWPVPDSREEIEQSGLFEGVRVARRVWAEEFTADEYVAMMGTASDHVLMEPDKRMRLFAEMRRLIDARPGSPHPAPLALDAARPRPYLCAEAGISNAVIENQADYVGG
jgi:hypothetical protein